MTITKSNQSILQSLAGDVSRETLKGIFNAFELADVSAVVFDPDDKILLCTEAYRSMNEDVREYLTPGMDFRELCKHATGLRHFDGQTNEEWLSERYERFRNPVSEFEERHSNGRWYKLNDVRTPSGYYIGFRQDITESKQTEIELTDRSRVLEAILEHMDEGISMVDANLKGLASNRRFFELLDFPPEKFPPGTPYEEYIRYNAERGDYGPGEIEEIVRQRIEQAGRFEAHSFERTRPDGTVIEIRGNPIPGGGMVTSYTDITVRRKAELAALEQEKRTRLIADGLPLIIVYVDPERRYRFVNSSFTAWYGKPEEEILGRHLEEIMGGAAYEMVRTRIDAAFEGEQQNFELEIPFVFAGLKLIQGVYIPHFDENGSVQGIYGLIIDITGKRRAEQAARDSEIKFSRMLAIATDAIIATDGKMRITVFNQGAEKIFGYRSDEVMGRKIGILIPDRFHQSHAGHVKHFLADGEDSRMMSNRSEIFGVRKDGTEFPAEASISKLQMSDETILTVLLHDITDRKRAEDELIAAKERAEYADRAKTDFLANMSHELRTPLNAIIGFSEMMSRQTFGALGDPHYEDYSEDIFSSGQHLLSLINDILDISRIEAGRTDLDDREIELAKITLDCQRLIEARATENGLSVCNNIDHDLPMLRADERLVKQILLNLLSNSVKFTNTGGEISIEAGVAADGCLRLSVSDTGIGMAADDIPKAIATFGQIQSDLNRKFEGTGLGLPLVKSLAELHGGGLEIESKLGAGTTATIWFPRERVVVRDN